MTSDQYKEFIQEWNRKYLIDFLHRREKGIVFNSQEHRAINLLDIYTKYIEESIALDLNEQIALNLDKKVQLSKGNWITSRTENKQTIEADEDLLDAFDKMDLSQFNNEKIKIE